MKGVIAIICAMSMCLLLIVTAFAAETSGNSFAIHAEKAEREAVLAEMRQTASNATLQEFGVIVDEGTMMPVYYGSLLDYAKTGEFVYEPFALGGKQLYVSDAIDAQGSFEGVMIFNADDIHIAGQGLFGWGRFRRRVFCRIGGYYQPIWLFLLFCIEGESGKAQLLLRSAAV